MKVEEIKNSEVKDYLLEHLEIGVLFSKLTEKADELSKAATIRAEIMGFNPTPAEVLKAEAALRKNMAEVILICEILACNTDAWDDVEDTQEEIARKWVESMMKDKGKGKKMPYGLKDEDFDKIQNEIVRKLYEIPSPWSSHISGGMHRTRVKGSNDRTTQNTQIEGENRSRRKGAEKQRIQKQKNKAFPKRLGGKEICEGVDESVRKNKGE